MQDYKKLKVWEKAHAFTLAVYQITAQFPRHEQYGLASQLQRCSSSVPSNIVEGCGLNSNKELLRHLHIAMGSSKEAEYQLLLAKDLGYISPATHALLDELVNAVERMLSALINTIKRGEPQGRTRE